MAEKDDSQDYQAKPKAKTRYKKKWSSRPVIDKKTGQVTFVKSWSKYGTPIEQPKPFKTSYGSVITGEHEYKGGKGKRVSKGRKKTVKKYGHGGGVGIQTHGNKLASALNTQTPDHSVYLNEDGYLKGGVKVRS